MAQSTLPRKHPYPDLESDDVEAQALLKGLNNYLGVTEPQRPPLLVKITGYRLVTTAVIAGLGVPKAIASYEGQSVVPTTLDWVSGVAAAVILYWIGLFEAADPPVLKWLLHDDYGPAILKVVRVFILSIHVCIVISVPIILAMHVFAALIPVFLAPLNSGDLSALAWIKFALYFALPFFFVYAAFWLVPKIAVPFRKHVPMRVKYVLRRAIEIATLNLKRYRAPGSNYSSAWDEFFPVTLGLVMSLAILPQYIIRVLRISPEETSTPDQPKIEGIIM